MGDELPSTEAFSGKVIKNEYMLTSQIPYASGIYNKINKNIRNVAETAEIN